jgi:hypothetical protein
MCTKPPSCVLFENNKLKPTTFQELQDSVTPVFPIERSITLKGFSVRRKQIPMCPAFCVTDYKVQGSTLATAILDLKVDHSTRGMSGHRKYCSANVQLSRLQTSEGLNLLRKLEMKDIQFSPDPRLVAEMERLRELQKKTIAAWGVSSTYWN